MDCNKRQLSKVIINAKLALWASPIVTGIIMPTHAATSCNTVGSEHVGLATNIAPLPSVVNISLGGSRVINIAVEIGSLYELGGTATFLIFSNPIADGTGASAKNISIASGSSGIATVTASVDANAIVGTLGGFTFILTMKGLRSTGCGNSKTNIYQHSVGIRVV